MKTHHIRNEVTYCVKQGYLNAIYAESFIINKPVVDRILLLLTLFQQFTTGGQAGYAHNNKHTYSIITLNLVHTAPVN